MIDLSDLQPGRLVRFEYPIRNYLDEPLTWTFRRIVIYRVIDLANSPIEGKWIRNRPQIRRGRYLVIGYDLDRKAERKYYFEAMKGKLALAWLQLYSFDPAEGEAAGEPLRCYPPTPQHRERLAHLIRKYGESECQQEDNLLDLCVVPARHNHHEHQSLRTVSNEQ